MKTNTISINTDKSNVIHRFSESFSSKWMLGEPRTVGSTRGSYIFIRRLFGEKPFCIWDILIHIEAVCKLTEDENGNTSLNYKIIRGYYNPIKIFIWYAILFIPILMTTSSNHMLDSVSPFVLYVVPALPITIYTIVTNICSRICKKADENIATLIEEIEYEVERINKYPEFNVKSNKFKSIEL